MIQEFRFNQYCERLQRQVILKLDDEFKMFMRWRGFNIDSGLFSIKFNPPQNFASYRQAELDAQRVNVFTALEGVPYISKRFAMQRFLGMTEEELRQNEELWEEESDKQEAQGISGSDLRSVGISPGDIDSDITTGEDLDAELNAPDADLGAGEGDAEV